MNLRARSAAAIVPTILPAMLLALLTGCGPVRPVLGAAAASAMPVSTQNFAADDRPTLPTGTPWNKEARADHLLGSIARSLGVVQRELDQARAARDVIKVQCVSDKLTQLRGLEDQARRNRSTVRTAVLDDDSADAPYASIAAADDRARSLRAEARNCVGEELAQKAGETGEADRDADGIVDSRDAIEDTDGAVDLPAISGKMRSLEDTVGGVSREVSFRSPAKLIPPSGLGFGPTNPTGGAGGGAAQAQQAQQTQTAPRKAMLIRTAEIALAVYEVDKNLDAVEKAATELGGYLALRSDRQITVRVPREAFDPLVARIERMGDVLHKNVAAEDVTDQWVDVEMRLKNATAVRARLEKLLDGATVRDAVEIHKELSKVTEEIERLQGKLKLLGDRVAYSTITVSFEPVQSQQVRSQALLPFPWMNTIGLAPLLRVPR